MGIRKKIQIKVVPKKKNSFYHRQYSCKLLILLIINVILLLLPINTVSAINNNKQRRQKQTKQRRYLLQERAADPNMFNYGSNQQQVQGSGAVAGSGNPFTYNSGLKNSRLAVDQSTAALMENLKQVNAQDNVHGVESQEKIIQEESDAIKNERAIASDIEQMKQTAMEGASSLNNENKKVEYPEIIRAIKWESQHKGKPTIAQITKENIMPTAKTKFSTAPGASTKKAKNVPKKTSDNNVDKVQPAAAVLEAKREIERKNKIIEQQKALINKIEKRKAEEKEKKKPKTPMQKDSAELSSIENQLKNAENAA